MRNLKCSLVGCSNRAYSVIKLSMHAGLFEVENVHCHKCHEVVVNMPKGSCRVLSVRILTTEEKKR